MRGIEFMIWNINTKSFMTPKEWRANRNIGWYYDVLEGGMKQMMDIAKNEIRIVDEVTIVQYSGFKDKDGKKIFEGHICKQGSLIVEVRFRYGCFFLCSPSDNGKIMNKGAIDFHHLAEQYEQKKERPFCKLEIIGHVLTNPELLKKAS